MSIIPKNTYHFSVDDVFDGLIEASDTKVSLFKQPFFKFLKDLNNKFKVSIGLHLFYQKKIGGKLRTLKEVMDLKKELSDNNWLFFGPHALDYETPPYAQAVDEQIDAFDKIYHEIDRFAGKDAYAKCIRLQYYSESFELADYFRKKGIEALFTTDRVVGSYRMPKYVGTKLYEEGIAEYQGMNFIRTQFRTEWFTYKNITFNQILQNFKAALQKYGYIVFYGHEIESLATDKGKEMVALMSEAAKELNVSSIQRP